MDNNYDDIINLPRPESYRPKMSALDRAAQFSPFAALTGYDAVIRETARLTERKTQLDESEKAVINGKLQMLNDFLDEKPEVTIVYFAPDSMKNGGEYVCATGVVRRICTSSREIIFDDGRTVPIDEIYDVESSLFGSYFVGGEL